MIQIEDLRLKNYVACKGNHGDYIAQVLAIDLVNNIAVMENGNVMWFGNKTEWINPIPLTPEILIKAGFKKFSHNPGYSIGSEEKSEKCIEYTKGKITIMDWGDGFVLSNSFSFSLRVEVKYLHDLQNLIYALTKTELELTHL